MGIESPKNERLNESEAHEEANMLRVQAGVFPKTGRVHGIGEDAETGKIYLENGGRVPSAEDYERALAEIEELKRAAKEDPTKIGALLHDFLVSTERGLNFFINFSGVPGAGVQMPEGYNGEGASVFEKIKLRWQNAREAGDMLAVLDDAKNELDFLKGRAERFGKQEELHDVNEK
jgi:hypothetical protein